LHSFSLNDDISVADFVDEQDLGVHFQLPLSIEAHTKLLQVHHIINDDTVDRHTSDKWEFAWGKSMYKSKDYYNFCFKDVVVPDYLQRIWKSKCIMKHKVFAWLMLVDRINTRDMLRRRRNMDIGSVFSCMLCDTGLDETRNHLFFCCPFSSSCWSEIGINWCTDMHLGPMVADGKQSWARPFFTEILILGSWNIWKIRNRVFFDLAIPEVENWKRQLSQDLEILQCRVKEQLRTEIQIFITLLS
jgi:hypothetical protein